MIGKKLLKLLAMGLFLFTMASCSPYAKKLVVDPASGTFGKELVEIEIDSRIGILDQKIRNIDQLKYKCIRISEKSLREDKHFFLKGTKIDIELIEEIEKDFGC